MFWKGLKAGSSRLSLVVKKSREEEEQKSS